MKQVILIHGRPDEEEFSKPSVPSPSNAHWFPWLQKQIAMKGEVCQALEFPFIAYQPDWEGWVSVIENFKVTRETVLVGHSTGGGFILKYLSLHPEYFPKKIILVAPWVDTGHELKNGFFDFEIDPSLGDRMEIHIFISSDDEKSLLDSFDKISTKLPGAFIHKFIDREHFCTPEFPELLELV